MPTADVVVPDAGCQRRRKHALPLFSLDENIGIAFAESQQFHGTTRPGRRESCWNPVLYVRVLKRKSMWNLRGRRSIHNRMRALGITVMIRLLIALAAGLPVLGSKSQCN